VSGFGYYARSNKRDVLSSMDSGGRWIAFNLERMLPTAFLREELTSRAAKFGKTTTVYGPITFGGCTNEGWDGLKNLL